VAFDLYEFPESFSGRKTYVTVRGHSKSIPCVYTYKGMDGRNYVLPEFGGDWSGYDNFSHAVQTPMIMRDISGYASPIDGAQITSRSEHRDHLRRHEVIEVGNERIGAPRPDTGVTSSGYTRDHLRKHIEEVKRMPQAAYEERVQKQKYESTAP